MLFTTSFCSTTRIIFSICSRPVPLSRPVANFDDISRANLAKSFLSYPPSTSTPGYLSIFASILSPASPLVCVLLLRGSTHCSKVDPHSKDSKELKLPPVSDRGRIHALLF